MTNENALEIRVENCEEVMNLLSASNNAHQKILEILSPTVVQLKNTIKDEVSKQLKDENIFNKAQLKEDVVSEVSDAMDNKIKDAVNDKGLNRKETARLTKARNSRFCSLLGDSKSDKYIILISFYQGAMVKSYRAKFECDAYGDVQADRLEEALAYIEKFDVDNGYYNWCIEKLHEQYRNGEIQNMKKYHAYERFFGIK